MNESRVSLGLVNPKSESNLAAILRACGCFGVNALFFTGQRLRYAKDYRADTQQVRHRIPNVGVDDLLAMKPVGAQTVAVELVENAIPLPHFKHPDNAFYIFGPEDGSIPQSLLDSAKHVVFIPTSNSLNLAATVNVVLYDRLAKTDFPSDNAFIRNSRDNNNNTRLG